MNTILSRIGGLALLAILLFVLVHYCAAPNTGGEAGKPMSRRESNRVQANIEKQHQRAKKDTLAAAALHKKAERTETNIQIMRRQAAVLQKKSVSHATPVPTTDTAIVRLQKYFSTYGDKPRPALPANLR